MRRVNRPTGNLFLDIHKRNEMYFAYAFFFENGDDVHVKVGISTVPYRRLKDIIHGSPFPISQAVYCHAGSKSVGREFEERVRRAMSERRTRGEWYVFHRSEGPEFRAAIGIAFAKATGRILKWSKVDLDAVRMEGKIASSKWHGRRGPEAA